MIQITNPLETQIVTKRNRDRRAKKESEKYCQQSNLMSWLTGISVVLSQKNGYSSTADASESKLHPAYDVPNAFATETER